MGDDNQPQQPLEMTEPNITVVRFIEYHGPQEWIDLVLQNSVIPIQGAKQFKEGRLPSGSLMKGAFIRSGLVMFQPDEDAGEAAQQATAAAQAQPQPTSVVEMSDGKGGKTVIHLPMPPSGKTQA